MYMGIFKRNSKDEKDENEYIMGEDSDGGDAAAESLPEDGKADENESPAEEKVREIDFARHFLPIRPVTLSNISYETDTPKLENGAEVRLGVRDTVVAQVQAGRGVKVTFNRTLSFDPDGPFVLSVSFAVMLRFNPRTASEVDWKRVDAAAQFRQKCPALMQSMMSRAALLVAEITAAAGGNPIIPLK